MASYTGSCHCGNLSFRFETAHGPDALELRACQCSFCRRHGALTASDPAGRAWLRVVDPSLLLRYRFGRRTADFWVCRRCGVYLGALMEEADRAWATLNTNTCDGADCPRREPVPVRYDAEDAAARRARRRQRWTPVWEIEERGVVRRLARAPS